MAVNKERVRLLVDALRSGEFEQGRGRLRTDDDKYCCLGVASEVARRNGVGGEWVQVEYTYDSVWTLDGADTALGRKVREWYGFRVSNPSLRFADGMSTMIGANDGECRSFVEIADAVVATYLNSEE